MTTSAPLVLVADDEPSMLELVARHLKTMDHPKLEVIQASDGEEAWRLAREHLPDLVVLDVMMPGMSGWEVCRKIREDIGLAHTGVVMLTGIGENLNQMTSPLYGADAYIDKPFEFEDFDDKVRGTLKNRESQRQGVVRPSINGTSGAAKPAPAAKKKKAAPAAKPAPAPAKKKAAKPAPAPAKKKKKVCRRRKPLRRRRRRRRRRPRRRRPQRRRRRKPLRRRRRRRPRRRRPRRRRRRRKRPRRARRRSNPSLTRAPSARGFVRGFRGRF